MKKVLKAKLDAAKAQIGVAERELEQALHGIHSASRAEKTKITEVVEDAFKRLRAAKADLLELEVLIEREEPDR